MHSFVKSGFNPYLPLALRMHSSFIITAFRTSAAGNGVDINRLFWGSRRGMLELDLVLMPFLENVYPSLEQSDKERYWKLLEEQDQDLFAWFLRRENPANPELQRIVDIIRANTGLQKQTN